VLNLGYEMMFSRGGRKRLRAEELRAITGRGPSEKFFRSMFRTHGGYKVGEHSYAYEPTEKFWEFEAEVTTIECSHEGGSYHNRILPGCEAEVTTIRWSERRAKDRLLLFASSLGFDFSVHPPARRDYASVIDNRCYDWWVNLRGDNRDRLFLRTYGDGWNYDIKSAKPTILLQDYDRLDLSHIPAALRGRAELPFWRELVQNKDEFRRGLATELNVPILTAKDIAQRLLNNSAPVLHYANGFVEDFGWDLTNRIIQSRICQGLMSDYRFFSDQMRCAKVTYRGNGDKSLRKGQASTSNYNIGENEVMNVIEPLVTAPTWFIHDGFFSAQRQEVTIIEEAILKATGRVVEVSEERIQASRVALSSV
jgi:hypothetical protein